MFQFIQLAQVFFPCLVDDVQQDRFFKSFHYFLTFTFVSGFQAAGDVVHTLTIRNGDKNVFIHMSLSLIHLLDNRISNLCHAVSLALEQIHGYIESLFCEFLFLLVAELLFAEWSFHSECLQEVHFAVFVVGSFNSSGNTIPDHVHDVHADTFTHQGMTTLGIHNGTLFVHYVIIFQQAFTDAEVIFFHLLLCTFDGVGNHLMFNHLTFLEAEAVHHTGNTVGGEQTHQFVFQ